MRNNVKNGNAQRQTGTATSLALFLASLCLGAQAQQMSKDAMIKRGEYLVQVVGCEGCHTPHQVGPDGGPPEIDMTRYLAGHPASQKVEALVPTGNWVLGASTYHTAHTGPWGISFAANLTPDDETGLGKWTPEEFIRTLREGRHKGQGRALLPPMPWTHFRNFSDNDLRSIFAYLRTAPPVKNKVPEPVAPASH